MEDEELYERIDRKIFEAGSQGYLPLKERLELRKSIFNSFRKLDILQQLLDDPEITEVMINGRDHIFVEESGVMHPWEYEFESDEQLEDMIQQVVSPGKPDGECVESNRGRQTGRRFPGPCGAASGIPGRSGHDHS